ncbi:MAG: helix-hairpin-helix domain-containing protein [Turicibacter sp.]|nr:helix-hairpin-helix domain-containing protein [Turicibacter sp.]
MKKQLAIIGAIGTILIVIGTALWGEAREEEFIPAAIAPAEIEEGPAEPMQTLKIVIDVKGMVNNPGIHEIEEGARVQDAIIAAGGLKEDAAVDSINLAERLRDEMVVWVPSIHDEALSLPTAHSPGSSNDASGLININEAPASLLQTLPGIGATRAGAIVQYRETTGRFQQLEDLKNVSGIGGATFENLRHLISH